MLNRGASLSRSECKPSSTQAEAELGPGWGCVCEPRDPDMGVPQFLVTMFRPPGCRAKARRDIGNEDEGYQKGRIDITDKDRMLTLFIFSMAMYGLGT